MTEEQFAFPKQLKEPINDARHARNAVARFDQVEGVNSRAFWRSNPTAGSIGLCCCYEGRSAGATLRSGPWLRGVRRSFARLGC